jgi:hypothetical protein
VDTEPVGWLSAAPNFFRSGQMDKKRDSVSDLPQFG